MNNSTQFDVLDVQDRTGVTVCIDFIDIKEITAPVMKGMAIFSWPFFKYTLIIRDYGWRVESVMN